MLSKGKPAKYYSINLYWGIVQYITKYYIDIIWVLNLVITRQTQQQITPINPPSKLTVPYKKNVYTSHEQ